MSKADETGDEAPLRRVQSAIDRLLDGRHGDEAAAQAQSKLSQSRRAAEKRARHDPSLRRKFACAAEATLGAGFLPPRGKRGHELLARELRAEDAAMVDGKGTLSDVEDLGAWRDDDEAAPPPRAQRRRAADGAEVEVSVGVATDDDHGLHSILKPHQQEALAFLMGRWEKKLGAVLALSMGLGKTLTALAFVQTLHAAAAVAAGTDVERAGCCAVVVCPKSVVPGWRAEHARHAAQLSYPCFVLDGLDASPATVRTWAERGGVLVVSAPTLTRLVVSSRSSTASAGAGAGGFYRETRTTLIERADVLVVDEMHLFKSAGSQTAQAIEAFATPMRVGLTGTPLSNSPDDFYDIAQLVDKSIFCGLSPGEFRSLFSKPIRAAQYHDASDEVQRAGREQTAVLRTLLAPCMMHRSALVLRGILPPKRETMLVYPVPDDKRQQIDAALIEAGGSYFSTQPILDKVLRPVKVRVTCGILRQLQKDEAAIVFSRHPETLLAVQGKLGAGIMRVLSGDTDGATRVDLLRDFEAGVVPVLGLSYGAGAVGLNCQRANVVVLVDPVENPTQMTQAVHRAWRMGQEQPVDVYRLAAEDTVDMRILRRGAVKEGEARNLLEKKKVDTHLNAADASGDGCSESVALLPPTVDGGTVDARVLTLGRAEMVTGWCSYDAFFDDVQDDATDAAAAQNNHHRKLNNTKRPVRTSDGVEHDVRGFLVDLPLLASASAGAARELISPPIPIVQCTVQGTTIELAPRAMPAGVTFEVSFRVANEALAQAAVEGDEAKGTAAWTAPESVPKRRFGRRKRAGDPSDRLVCRARFVRLASEDRGPWSVASAPFALRDDGAGAPDAL